MKPGLLMGAALLALAVSQPAVSDQRFTFTFTGSIVTYTVPITGMYQILAFGAQGGDGVRAIGSPSPLSSGPGGLGAETGGDFSLNAGEVLQIAVGGAGQSDGLFSGGGGGGGSFVVGPGNTPLVIAGGGGGGGAAIGPFGLDGGDGLTGPNGGQAGQAALGGTNGNGGSGSPRAPGAGGGGGFLSAGGGGGGPRGGGAFPALTGGTGGGIAGSITVGGGMGGFGGGGGGYGACGGGGGGYSGGGGAGEQGPAGCFGGGGGGSFDAGTNQTLVAGIQTGNGEVVITQVPPVFAGKPGEANCHGKSVSALAQQFGGLNGAAAGLGFSDVPALQNAIMQFCGG